MFIFMLNKNIAYLKNLGGNLKKRQDAKISLLLRLIKTAQQGFSGGAVVENLPANAGDTSLSPGLGRSHMPWSN